MDPCLFCRIVKGEIPAARAFEDEHTIVFRDISPQAPVHLLAVPRVHYAGIHEIPAADMAIVQRLFETVNTVVARENLTKDGYRLVVNFGANGGQAVPHIHVHILGGRAMQWPPG